MFAEVLIVVICFVVYTVATVCHKLLID